MQKNIAKQVKRSKKPPAVLAPAGCRDSFLAAVAAGADAVYCGLKAFSARMKAKNFTIAELASLSAMAREKGVMVNVAFNSMIKDPELGVAEKLLRELYKFVKPDGLIIQDAGIAKIAVNAGFPPSSLHLSTLAGISCASEAKAAKKHCNIKTIVLPREFTVDEIKTVAACCPEIDFEVFIHGALCYAVSGRCYWSGRLGGYSGLRGRCLQPCRRRYEHRGAKKTFFSCSDLHADMLVKALLPVPNLTAWKIEGRKKGPHYVWHTVRAYKILRDAGVDAAGKREAADLLQRALGRAGTHYNFLPQRRFNPIDTSKTSASGLAVGEIRGTPEKPWFTPRQSLFKGDLLRVGFQDDSCHRLIKVRKDASKRRRFHVPPMDDTILSDKIGVFLIDRREKAVLTGIRELAKELRRVETPPLSPTVGKKRSPAIFRGQGRKPLELTVHRGLNATRVSSPAGIWLDPEKAGKVSAGVAASVWWWLPPVIWSDDEAGLIKAVDQLVKKGARTFVVNSLWQVGIFRNRNKPTIFAGPFCNLANSSTLTLARNMGIKGAILSPELGREDYETLPGLSPVPLGLVISGMWPLCISRTLSDELRPGSVFTSPAGEQGFVRRYGPDFWIFPCWRQDISSRKRTLRKAGYSFFVHLDEPLPKGVKLRRKGETWNWRGGLP